MLYLRFLPILPRGRWVNSHGIGYPANKKKKKKHLSDLAIFAANIWKAYFSDKNIARA